MQHQIHRLDCTSVDNTLYCVHRYFFSRGSIYFSTRFVELDICDHEPLPTVISLGDIELTALIASSPSYIPSEISSPLFISLLIRACLRVVISKKTTSPMKSGNPWLTSQLAGALLLSASWHWPLSSLQHPTIVSYSFAHIQLMTG